jgi:hypothetical protein
MKVEHVCTCGARVYVEDDDAKRVRLEVGRWDKAHRCGISPWHADHRSTTASVLAFGFNADYTGHGRGLTGPEERR